MRLDFQTGRVGRSTESGLKPSKRRHYRVTGNDLNGISVSLKIAGQSKPVQLIDISSAGAALAFIGAEKAQVASLFGTTLRPPEVEILANQLGETIRLSCRVAHLQQVAAGVICGVAFLREIDDSFNLDQALLRVFNRRGAVRVEPDPQTPVTIQIHSPDGHPLCSGLLRDLSLTGLGIAVAPVDMALLPRDSSVALRFALAGEVFDMPAIVRFGRVSSEQRPGGVTPEPVGIVGLELDDQARNQAANRKRLADWVMRRQREIQRIQREAADPSTAG